LATHSVRTTDSSSVTRFLGWFSLGLGAAQISAPRLVCRVVGAKGEGSAPTLMRVMGVRELAQGLGILGRPRPTAWVWSRVAGDALDLALLLVTAARNPGRRGRAAFAIANVAAVAVPDVKESLRLSRLQGEPQGAKLIRKGVTIHESRIDVEAAWLGAEQLRRKVGEAGATVTFRNAPGDRGTELVVEYLEDPPVGDLGRAALKLSGKDVPTQLSDDLRRFKQEVETGEVIRSDSTPEGHLLASHMKQRPAQPLEEAVR
jgi:hypothetical protein